jgi:nucleoside-diphosphate-sugar epimerase
VIVELLDHGYEVIVVDVYEPDVRDRRALSAVIDRHTVDAVLHFARAQGDRHVRPGARALLRHECRGHHLAAVRDA